MALAFVITTVALRLLEGYIHNDHFMHLAEARQILFGELPIVDFHDQGFFLQVLISAVLQELFGYRLLAEILWSILMIGCGTALTFLLARRFTGSTALALSAATFVLLSFPRLYSYPKILLYPLAVWVVWRYLDSRRITDLVLIGVLTAVAFLFRHDHGVYIGAAAVVTLFVAHTASGPRMIASRLSILLATAALLALPLLLYVQSTTGLMKYLEEGVTYTGQEQQRTTHALPWFVEFGIPRIEILPPPPFGPSVGVRWVAGLSEQTRAALEARYQLTHRVTYDDQGVNSDYYLANPSPENIRLLVNDPSVADTRRIDRSLARATAEPVDSQDTLSRHVPLLRLQFVGGIADPGNALPLLIYGYIALPCLALIVLVRRGLAHRGSSHARGVNNNEKLLFLTMLFAAALPLSLRLPFADRLADISPLAGLLGAGLFACWLGPWPVRRMLASLSSTLSAGRQWTRARLRSLATATVRLTVTTLLTIVMLLLIATVARLGGRFDRSELTGGPARTWGRIVSVADRFAVSPPSAGWKPTARPAFRELVSYVEACTRPSDRLLITWFEPSLYFYSGRGFAAGHVYFVNGMWNGPEQQTVAIERLQDQRVPVVLSSLARLDAFRDGFPKVWSYLEEHYAWAGQVASGDESGEVYGVLIDTRLASTGMYDALSLPCYRES